MDTNLYFFKNNTFHILATVDETLCLIMLKNELPDHLTG